MDDQRLTTIEKKIDLLLSFFRVGETPPRSPIYFAQEAARLVAKMEDRQRKRSLGNNDLPGEEEAKRLHLSGDQGGGRHPGTGTTAPAEPTRSHPGYRGRHDNRLPAMGQTPPVPKDGQG
jgi:hypothetical protein